jgi:hypothetical protein
MKKYKSGFWKPTPTMALGTITLFQKDIGGAIKDLITKGNVDFDKAIQFIQPPRILLLVAVMICF